MPVVDSNILKSLGKNPLGRIALPLELGLQNGLRLVHLNGKIVPFLASAAKRFGVLCVLALHVRGPEWHVKLSDLDDNGQHTVGDIRWGLEEALDLDHDEHLGRNLVRKGSWGEKAVCLALESESVVIGESLGCLEPPAIRAIRRLTKGKQRVAESYQDRLRELVLAGKAQIGLISRGLELWGITWSAEEEARRVWDRAQEISQSLA